MIAGRREAFEPFVDRYGPLILNFGRRICGHLDNADDVLQETLLRAYLSLKDLRDPSALKGWIYRVAAHACLRIRRKGKFEPKHQISLDEVLPTPVGEGKPLEVPDWSEVPLDRVLQEELRGELEKAILSLPRDFRMVVVLRDQEGFSTRETAKILGISPTLAKVRLHRARLAVRKDLEGYFSSMSRPTRGKHHAAREMTCRERVEYVSDYVDGELDAALRSAIDAHGGKCPPCKAFIKTLERTIEIICSQPRRPLSSQVKKKLATALRNACA